MSSAAQNFQTGMGLSIDANGYARNKEQRDLLWEMTETQFIQNGRSLKRLLAFIVSSNYFNRRPPAAGDGAATPAGATEYEVPMIFNPWVEQDPRKVDADYDPAKHPERHHNAMTEAMRRASARTMMLSATSALDWPAPAFLPSGEFPPAI